MSKMKRAPRARRKLSAADQDRDMDILNVAGIAKPHDLPIKLSKGAVARRPRTMQEIFLATPTAV